MNTILEEHQLIFSREHQLTTIREMEIIEHVLFVEIFGLELASPFHSSLNFDFLKANTTSLHSIDVDGFGICFEICKKCSKMRSLNIPSL